VTPETLTTNVGGKAGWSLASVRVALRNAFPTHALSSTDLVLGGVLLCACFVLFFHFDMWGVGWDSLNYLFGPALDFYENCKKIRGGGESMLGTPYPPSIYIVFALWLYPLKLFGWIGSAETLSFYWTYWLKVLTTIVYAGSGVQFYRISLEYSPNKAWAKFAAVAWLTMPVALYSQFIFSQYDIFYVVLTLAGFLMFLRRRLGLASLYFSIAITFKYFPAFTFLPLLLLYEKRISRIALYGLIFVAPTLLINLLYGGSPAFIEGVHQHFSIDRIYAATIDIGLSGLWNAYALPMSCVILCGLAYFSDPSDENRPRVAAYFWLASATTPFLFIYWHPQWIMCFAAPIVLTSVIQRDAMRWLLLDIVGMLFCIGTISNTFVSKADAALFHGDLFGLDFSNAYLMSDLFGEFGSHSLNMFYSGFWAYLILQLAVKARRLLSPISSVPSESFDYGVIRSRFYLGLSIFLLPAALCIYKDLTGNFHFITNFGVTRTYGPLFGARVFEQPFVAEGASLKEVSVLLEAPPGALSDEIHLDIADPDGDAIARADETIQGSTGTTWHRFTFNSVPLRKDALYKIRLTSPKTSAGDGVFWWASFPGKDGRAMIDGVHEEADLAFRIGFVK
jgi:primosomal replication protein N